MLESRAPTRPRWRTYAEARAPRPTLPFRRRRPRRSGRRGGGQARRQLPIDPHLFDSLRFSAEVRLVGSDFDGTHSATKALAAGSGALIVRQQYRHCGGRRHDRDRTAPLAGAASVRSAVNTFEGGDDLTEVSSSGRSWSPLLLEKRGPLPREALAPDPRVPLFALEGGCGRAGAGCARRRAGAEGRGLCRPPWLDLKASATIDKASREARVHDTDFL